MSYQKEKDFIVGAIVDAWTACKDAPVAISDKSAFDPVTNLDTSMERFISARIASEFAGDFIIGEEFNPVYGLPKGRCWVIDPIDGTANMSHGLDLFGVQIAFFDGGEVVASAIYLPFFEETYTAIKGEGAYLNGKRINVIERDVKRAMISFGDCSHKRADIIELRDGLMSKFWGKIGKIRNFGAASIDFAWTACGRTDGMVMFTKNIWDIYPGLLICREAGAHILSLDGSQYDYASSEGICVVVGDGLKKLVTG